MVDGGRTDEHYIHGWPFDGASEEEGKLFELSQAFIFVKDRG